MEGAHSFRDPGGRGRVPPAANPLSQRIELPGRNHVKLGGQIDVPGGADGAGQFEITEDGVLLGRLTQHVDGRFHIREEAVFGIVDERLFELAEQEIDGNALGSQVADRTNQVGELIAAPGPAPDAVQRAVIDVQVNDWGDRPQGIAAAHAPIESEEFEFVARAAQEERCSQHGHGQTGQNAVQLRAVTHHDCARRAMVRAMSTPIQRGSAINSRRLTGVMGPR